MKIHKKEYNHTLLVGEDRVIASAPVSHEGGKFLAAWGQVQIVAAADINIANAVMLMARGVVAIYPDVGSTTFDADELWDAIVPKDEALSTTAQEDQIDTDFEEGDEETVTFSEPGLINPTIVAENNGIWAERVYDHEEVMTFAKTSDGFKDGTPDTYIPNTIFDVMASKNVSMDHHLPPPTSYLSGVPSSSLNQSAADTPSPSTPRTCPSSAGKSRPFPRD